MGEKEEKKKEEKKKEEKKKEEKKKEEKEKKKEEKKEEEKKEEEKKEAKTETKHSPAKIKGVIEGFKRSKAKVVAMRAEIMTLRARKAAMQKYAIKERLKPTDGAKGGDSYLGAALGNIHMQ